MCSIDYKMIRLSMISVCVMGVRARNKYAKICVNILKTMGLV